MIFPKMKHLFIVLLVISFFTGCELFYPSPDEGVTYDISIGLSYEGTGLSSSSILNGTVNDATELANAFTAVFSDRNQGTYLMIQDSTNNDPTDSLYPTKEHVLQQIEDIVAAMTEEDILVISYSGHGIEDTGSLVLTNSDGSIVNSDHTAIDTDALVTVDELYTAIQDCEGNVLLLIDSCYAGNFVQESDTSLSSIETTVSLASAYAKYFESGSSVSNVYVIAATTSDNTSKEPSWVASGETLHGYFSGALLGGLYWDEDEQALTDEDSRITVDSLYEYVIENQEIPISGTDPDYYQHPTINGGPLDLILR